MLWYDNGDGISTAKELKPLNKAIQSISLVYDGSTVSAVGERAEARQKSTFTYVKNGKHKEGVVIDYWFTPAKGSVVSQK